MTEQDERAYWDKQVDYWQRVGAIAPALPAVGSGSRIGWSPRDVARLHAIGYLVSSLVPVVANQISTDLIAVIWEALAEDDSFSLDCGPFRIDLAVPS